MTDKIKFGTSAGSKCMSMTASSAITIADNLKLLRRPSKELHDIESIALFRGSSGGGGGDKKK